MSLMLMDCRTDNSIPNLLKTTVPRMYSAFKQHKSISRYCLRSLSINADRSDDLQPLNISGFITNLYPLRIYLGLQNTIFIYNLYNRFKLHRLCPIGLNQPRHLARCYSPRNILPRPTIPGHLLVVTSC